MRRLHAWLCLPLLLVATVVLAEETTTKEPVDAGTTDAPKAEEPKAEPEKEAPKQTGPKMISGMSVLGNQEAPKSLVIVPWQSSQLGNALGITAMLDDSRQPIDRDVFLRALSYYEIRAETTP